MLKSIKTKIEIKSNFKKQDYLKIVEKAKEYISAGDIFQVVASQRFHCEYFLSSKSLYRSLRRRNPSPFLVNLNFEDFEDLLLIDYLEAINKK